MNTSGFTFGNNNSTNLFPNSNTSSNQQSTISSFSLQTPNFNSNLNKPQPTFGIISSNPSSTFSTAINNQSSNMFQNLSNQTNQSTGFNANQNGIFSQSSTANLGQPSTVNFGQSTTTNFGFNNTNITGSNFPNSANQSTANSSIFSVNSNSLSTNGTSLVGQSIAPATANQNPTGAFSLTSNNLSLNPPNPISINNSGSNPTFSFGLSTSNATASAGTTSLGFLSKSTGNSPFGGTNQALPSTAANNAPQSGFGAFSTTQSSSGAVTSPAFSFALPQASVASSTAPIQSGFGLVLGGAVSSTTSGGLSLNLSVATPSTAVQPAPFGALAGGFKSLASTASPLASTSVSAKKGLGGSPISESSKSNVSKDSAQKFSIVKQVKDTELQPEIKETVEAFKKFVAEQKKLREEIVKSNDIANLMTRVDEESQILRHSISEVANGLQKIQVQSNKLKSDISKDQSSIKIAQTNSDPSRITVMDYSESSIYFTNKVRELETRVGLYLQEIEVVESMCNSSNKQTLTTRDLVEIIRKMDDEFIGLAAKLYMVHERVKTAKIDFLRRLKQSNNNQNPFASIEGRFGETFESVSGISNNTSYKKPNFPQNSAWKFSENVGSSPFDNSCYLNQASSFSVPKVNSPQKPNIFGLNNNNNQPIGIGTTTTTTPFSFTNTTSTFSLNKPPTNLFLNDSVSNKKRR